MTPSTWDQISKSDVEKSARCSSFWKKSPSQWESQLRVGNFIECSLCQDIEFPHPSQNLCVIFDLSLCSLPISYEKAWGRICCSCLCGSGPMSSARFHFLSLDVNEIANSVVIKRALLPPVSRCFWPSQPKQL